MLSHNEAVGYLETLRGQSDPAGGKKFIVNTATTTKGVTVHVTDSSGTFVANGPTLEAAVTTLLKDDSSWPQK